MIKTLYILSFLFTLQIVTSGQTDTTYYDNDWKESARGEATFYSVIYREKNGDHLVEDRYIKTNALQMTGHFTSIDPEVKTGYFVYYDKDGHKTSEGNYDHNKQSGEWKSYYSGSDDVWHVDKFVNDSLAELTSYYKSGRIKRKETYFGKNKSTGKCFDEQGREIAFTQFETMPKPTYDLNDYLMHNLHYPNKARRADVEGRVIIKFVVDDSGNITDAEVTKHVSKELDNEAIRVVSNMPKWTPGTIDGTIVKVYFTLPVFFRLE